MSQNTAMRFGARELVSLVTGGLFLFSASPKTFGGDFSTEIHMVPLAVEVQTGRAEPHEYAGYVGTRFLDATLKAITVVEFFNAPEHPAHKSQVQLRRLAIESLDEFGGEGGIAFDCVDDLGLPWHGKIYRFGNQGGQKYRVEIIRNDQPRRIVTITNHGRDHLRKMGLSHIDLGASD